jgi:hypothetical protein
MDKKLLTLLKKLTDKEREALTSAVSALYFKEEYEKALWAIVITMVSDDLDEEGIDIKNILTILDPDLLDNEEKHNEGKN